MTQLREHRSPSKSRPTSRARRRRRPAMEQLESRQLLTASIFVSDATLNEIGDVSAFISPGNGGLSAPTDLVQGPDGNIYVASRGANSVLRYDGTTGAFLGTFVASGSGGLNNPDGVAFGPDGNFYVASGGTNAILKYNGTTGAFLNAFVPSGSGGLDNPRGIVFGEDGNLYVSSFFTHSILRYSGTSGAFMDAFVAPGSGGLSRPLELVFGSDGDLYVGIWDLGSPSAISRFDGVTGSFVSNFVPRGSGGISNPRGLAFDQDGRLYVADYDTNSIHRYDSQGQYLDDLVGSTTSPLRIPMGITFDAQGALLVSSNNWDTNAVFRYDRSVVVSLSTASAAPVTVDYQTVSGSAVAPNDYTAQTGTITFTPGQTTRRVLLATKDDVLPNGNRNFAVQLSNATGGATIGAGSATVTVADDDAVRQFTISDTSVVEGDYAAHYRGTFVEVTPGVNLGNSAMFDGNYFYTSPGPSSAAPIDRYDATTGAFVDHFIPASLQLSGVRSPVIHGGFLYVGSEYSDTIQRYDAVTGAPAGISGVPGDAVFVSAGSGGIDGPHGLSFGPDGNLYVSGINSSNVVRYDATTGQPLGSLNTSGVGSLQAPSGLTIDTAGVAYVASTATNQVQRYNTATGAYLGAITYAALSGPRDVKIGPDGLLYVLSADNNRILRFTTAGAFVDDYVRPGSGGMNNLSRMAFGPDGDLYVSGLNGNNFIYRFGTENEAVFTVMTSAPSSVTVSVDFSTVSGSATSGTDFTLTSGTATFAPGTTSTTILVPILDDAASEATESFTVNLSNPVGAVIADGQAVASILDNDPFTKFYVVNDAASDRTYEYAPSGAAVENYVLNSGNTTPRGAASTAAGDKVWSVDANRKVYVYNTSGGLLGSWTAGTLASNATVEGITTNGTDVWIVDARSDKVYKYTGAASRLSGSQNAASSFTLNINNRSPKDLVTDGTYLYVINDSSTDKVFKYTLSGSLVGSWTMSGGGGSPTGITLDPSNVSHLWVVDNATDRVYQYDAAVSRTSGSQTPSTSFALAAGNTNPQGIADPPPASASLSDASVAAAESEGTDIFASWNGLTVIPPSSRWDARMRESTSHRTLTSSNRVDAVMSRWDTGSEPQLLATRSTRTEAAVARRTGRAGDLDLLGSEWDKTIDALADALAARN